ncbi:hypothetical protein JRO89_XS08G0087700 [Xanthoceras sorbifolium]|uniref:Ferrochelatase n=1 Tax=Xanthoceras sorbifolium TaxID=99658 RepID=A0ABQ8HPA8_9ROSI|nr:hypothetical protein JRO89_XS08G0087700 [Xanthoceras sorbifolium]
MTEMKVVGSANQMKMKMGSCSPSSCSTSSTFHPPCFTSVSRNCKFPLLLPRAMCTSQRMYRCSSVHMEACLSSNLSANYIVSRYSSGWSETLPLLSKQPLNKDFSSLGALVTSKTQYVSTAPLIGDEKIGVLLLNLGGPETLEDDIIRLPRLFRFLQKPLAQFISVVRAPKSKEGYASIGGGSPLRRITDAQACFLVDEESHMNFLYVWNSFRMFMSGEKIKAEELRKSLWEKNVPAKVYVGMRYWHPFTEEAIEQIKRDGIAKLVVLPLYPQFSISTSGSSLRLLESIFREDEYLVNMQHTVIPSWYQREGYIKAMANLIEEELTNFDCPEKVVVGLQELQDSTLANP